MNRFWRSFIPYQLWRFVVLNAKMYLVAKGIVGPHGRPADSRFQSADLRAVPRP